MSATYEPWLEAYVPLKGRTFIDVGANRGVWTRWLAPGYEIIHAIEPNPAVLGYLQHNLPKNVIIHRAAAWSRSQMLDFRLYAADGHTSAYFKDQGIETGKPVSHQRFPAAILDVLVPPTGVVPTDLIKIDTEGAEFEVLLGAELILELDKPKLIIEVHSPENEEKIGPWLSSRGYFFEIVRNPNFPEGSEMWKSHCWFIASAR